MRRRSENAANKKAKAQASPERTVEKAKRPRTRRNLKQSSSTDNESVLEENASEEVKVVESEVKGTDAANVESTEESGDKVWQVKTAQGSGDMGEIQKLKICLARPSATPERTIKSPRSKRKQSRTTSSSDSASVEIVEKKKKSKHRSRRQARESKDSSEKNQESESDDPDKEQDITEAKDSESCDEPKQTETAAATPENVSEKQETVIVNKEPDSDEIVKGDESKEQNSNQDTTQDLNIDSKSVTEVGVETDKQNQMEDEKNTEDSTDKETQEQISKKDSEASIESLQVSESVQEKHQAQEDAKTQKDEINQPSEQIETVVADVSKELQEKGSEQHKESDQQVKQLEEQSGAEQNNTAQTEKQEQSVDDKHIEGRAEKNENHEESVHREKEKTTDQVSIDEEMSNINSVETAKNGKDCETTTTNRNDVVEKNISRERTMSTDSNKDKYSEESREHHRYRRRRLERTESTQSNHDDTASSQTAPLVVNRKRRWGSRPAKVTTQKSITISTDVLKDIIPDVKPVEFNEVIEEKKPHKRVEVVEKIERPVLPKIVIDNTEAIERMKEEKDMVSGKEPLPSSNRKISIVKDNDVIARPPSPPKHKQSCVLYITNLVRPFTLLQLKNLLQRTGRIVDDGFWIDRIKSKCYVIYETEDQAVETRHALHGVTWPVSNPKTLHVDFSTKEMFDKAKSNEEANNAPVSTIPGTVEDWLREQDIKRERGELGPWDRTKSVREWDVGKGDKPKDEKFSRDDKNEKRRHKTPERSPEPAKKFKKEEPPAKLLDDLFRKTKTTPSIYWLPLSAETIAVKEEQRRQHMAEHERRLNEFRRHRRH